MTSRRLLGVGLAAAGLLGALGSRPAQGAVQIPCAPAAMSPTATTIPVNLPAFGYTALKATASDVRLTKSGDSVEVPLDVGPVQDNLLKIAPKSPLTVGATYTLSFESFCSYGPYPAQPPLTFTVAPAAPIPTVLGTVAAPSVTVEDFGTSRFTLSTKVALDPSMAPWIGVYVLGLTVDGRPVQTKATVSAAKDSVQIDAVGWCDDALAKNPTHEIAVRARLPFAPALSTVAVSAAFACAAPNLTTPTPGPLPTSTPVSVTDAGVDGGSTARPTSSGGGCSTARTSTRPAWPVALSLLVLSLWSRRRQRSRREGEA
ncbi:MAG: hypothetical protein U0235_26295 [Polyangiaceae bacterium]